MLGRMFTRLALSASLVLASSLAGAAPPALKAPQPSPAAPEKAEPTPAPDAKPSYRAEIVRGAKAFAGGNPGTATEAFDAAIAIDESRRLAHYMRAQVQFSQAKFTEALATLQNAMRGSGEEDIQLKTLAMIALAQERLTDSAAAITGWKAYASFADEHPKLAANPGVATERTTQIERRGKLEAEYAKVKERAKKRLEDREKEALDNAKKDTKNL